MGLIFACLLVFNPLARALDPYAGAKFKNAGMLHVQTPDASKDEITLTNLKTGKVEGIKSGKLEIVPAGTYQLHVVMAGEIYNGKVTVRRTERTDVTVGFGKLKVKGSRSALVKVFEKKQGKLVAEFPANKTQLLPRGLYEVKINVNGMEGQKSDVLIVSSKTSELKIRS
jgi:hypothetical protein